MKHGLQMVPAVALLLAACATQPPPRGDIRIDDTGVHPESVTSTRAGDVIVGSIKGRLYRAGPTETVARVWVEPSAANSLQSVFGVLAHDSSSTLWVCSVPNPFAPPKPGAVNELVALDLKSGELKARYPFPPGRSVCNDASVAPNGAVYVADTQGGRILRLPRADSALEDFAADERLRGVDGIAFAGDGRLYVNNVTTGAMYRVGLGPDGKFTGLTELRVSDKLGGPDGLRLIEGNRFVQAEGTTGRIAEVTIAGDEARVRVLREGLDSSPGVTPVGNTAYAIEGKIRFLIDPKLRGQDAGEFRVVAVPIN